MKIYGSLSEAKLRDLTQYYRHSLSDPDNAWTRIIRDRSVLTRGHQCYPVFVLTISRQTRLLWPTVKRNVDFFKYEFEKELFLHQQFRKYIFSIYCMRKTAKVNTILQCELKPANDCISWNCLNVLLWRRTIGCTVIMAQHNSRRKMRDFTGCFWKYAQFHGKFTEFQKSTENSRAPQTLFRGAMLMQTKKSVE